ncbi:uncharacterized protein [Narcine bancroftii]|uniref:uncharacterized protein isoform X2 n=1 Tax=Narcine bancroftii TaxID=1343680 RepID=UPI0038321430
MNVDLSTPETHPSRQSLEQRALRSGVGESVRQTQGRSGTYLNRSARRRVNILMNFEVREFPSVNLMMSEDKEEVHHYLLKENLMELEMGKMAEVEERNGKSSPTLEMSSPSRLESQG